MVWKRRDLEVWRYGGLGVWKCGVIETCIRSCRYESMEVCRGKARGEEVGLSICQFWWQHDASIGSNSISGVVDDRSIDEPLNFSWLWRS